MPHGSTRRGVFFVSAAEIPPLELLSRDGLGEPEPLCAVAVQRAEELHRVRKSLSSLMVFTGISTMLFSRELPAPKSSSEVCIPSLWKEESRRFTRSYSETTAVSVSSISSIRALMLCFSRISLYSWVGASSRASTAETFTAMGSSRCPACALRCRNRATCSKMYRSRSTMRPVDSRMGMNWSG